MELYERFPHLPRTPEEGCPTCHHIGEQDGIIKWRGEQWKCNCKDQLQRHKHYCAANIGEKYQRLDWSDWFSGFDLQKLNDYRQNLKEYVERGQGLAFWGEMNGTGKTLLAILMLKACIAKGYSCYFTTSSEMMEMVKGGWHSDDDRARYDAKCKNVDVLLIDDVGKEMLGDGRWADSFAKNTIESLIRIRTQQNRPTFITSNCSMQEIRDNYSRSLASLLSETMNVIHVEGQDGRSLANRNVTAEIANNETRPIW